MKAVVLAYHNMGCMGIDALIENGFEIAAVFTHPDHPGEKIWFDSVAMCAAGHGIPVYSPEDINHPIWVKKLTDLQPDVLFSFYYRKLVKAPILEIPTAGCFNLHGSLLPKYRGRSPINWALVHGETVSGVTLHHMTLKPDQGDIVGQAAFEIAPTDDAKDVFAKAIEKGHALLAEVLPQIKAGTAKRTPQDHSQATYFGGRRPKDGEIHWHESDKKISDLVRAVSDPYPGAFAHCGNRKVYFWEVRQRPDRPAAAPGTVIETKPFVIACGTGAIEVVRAQIGQEPQKSGAQVAEELGLKPDCRFDYNARRSPKRKKKVLILGVNGFIGNHLSQRLLDRGGYEIYGMDLHYHCLEDLMTNPDFHFFEGDIRINKEWIEYHVRKCDVVLPLVAIATPAEYTRNPLRVFELDFEENLRIIRHCVKYNKKVIFPSTSEVYGMCRDASFSEENSQLVLGPIHKQRWIYSCSKQLLDRVIWAYGQSNALKFSIFRPFNWIGPRLDSLQSARIGSSRVITQLILNLVEGTPILLVDGGSQRRCFTDIKDGVACLEKIIENKNGCSDGRIFNIGNPDNDLSIAELGRILVESFKQHPLRKHFPPFAGFEDIEATRMYGEGYEDIGHRKPNISRAKQILGWRPEVVMSDSVAETLDYFLEQAIANRVDHETWVTN